MEPCQHVRSAKAGDGRRYCHDCNRKYTPGAKARRPKVTETCPSCGVRDAVRSGAGRLQCRPCGRTWYAGRQASATLAGGKRTVVLTSAVNDSPAFLPGLRALKVFCEHRDAQLLIAPLRYKNPTSQAENAAEYTWVKEVLPYLTEARLQVCTRLQFLADIKTQPTASNPLSGLDTITGADCGVVPHTKVHLDTIATRGGDLPKIMVTTGAITRPVYSDTKAGKKGEFHHVLGAVVVEIDDDETFFIRHVLFNRDGSFIDLDTRYTATGHGPAPRAKGLRLGDVHAERIDPQAHAAAQEIIDLVRPEHLILDDVLDFGSASHHNGFFEKFLRRHQKRDCVADELRRTCEVIDGFHRAGQKVAIVSSNHHDHLVRWLSDHRNGEDVQNAVLYHDLKAAVLSESLKAGRMVNPFALAARRLLKHPVTFLSDRDSYVVAGIENAFHGDKGPNGARGSAKGFDRIGLKTNIGHSHTPRIVGGCYQGGTTSLLDMGYNVGPSSWMHCHTLTYANGKRTLLFIINGKYRRRP